MQAANLPGPDAQQLQYISEEYFDLEDYSKSDLSAQIWIKGADVMKDVKLSPADILFCAVIVRWIESYYEPTSEHDYLVEVAPGELMTFKLWWDSLDPIDTEALFSKAISTTVRYGLTKIYQNLGMAA